MQVRHLTDEEIQNYLDGNKYSNSTEIEKHLELCIDCQTNVYYYRKLYAELKDDTDIILPADFSHLVISKLSFESKHNQSFIFSDVFLGITGVIISVTAMLFYYDLNSLRALLNQFTSLQVEFDLTFFSLMKDFWIGLNGNLYVLIIAGFILFSVYEIDCLILQPKLKRINQKLS